MSPEITYAQLQAEMAELLKQTRQRARFAAARARVPAAVARVAQMVAATAVFFLVWRLYDRWRGHDLPAWSTLLWFFAFAVVESLIVVLGGAIVKAPDLRAAAQSLNPAACDYERVAVALAALDGPDQSSQVCVAIADGMEHLRRLKNAAPAPAVPGTWKFRQIGYALAITAVFVASSAWISPAPKPSLPASPTASTQPAVDHR